MSERSILLTPRLVIVGYRIAGPYMAYIRESPQKIDLRKRNLHQHTKLGGNQLCDSK